MATKKKMLQAAAGQAGGAGLDITEVFSTYLLQSTTLGVSETVSNGVDLLNEGGLVWSKARDGAGSHILVDTERGASNCIFSDTTGAQVNINTITTQFYSDGFESGSWINSGGTAQAYASWTFRKAPKFFTMVTWSGNSTMGRTISHDLGADVGFILIKAVDKADAWYALHKDSNMLVLNQTTAEYSDATTADYFGDGTNIVRPTSTEFTIGSDAGINGTGYNYVAYLFAHNDGDGDFGPDGDQDIIKCGSYTGDQLFYGPEIDLGFEPQWLMIKNVSSSGDWFMVDTMRGVSTSSTPRLRANGSSSESVAFNMQVRSNGFQIVDGDVINGSGQDYIYIAIRRGPLAPPESGTEVFAVEQGDGSSVPAFDAGFPVDFALLRRPATAEDNRVSARLTGNAFMATNLTDAEDTTNTNYTFDFPDGFFEVALSSDYYAWMWKRAPNFFDVVAYTGSGTAGRTVSHNLGVAPEMMWVKRRNSTGGEWQVYHSGLNGGTNPEQYAIELNSTGAEADQPRWNDTAPTDAVFSLGDSYRENANGDNYIAYLFASLDGVSKVGSWSGTGGTNTQVIDCGFSAGARFVLIKRTNASQDWLVFDTERGITSGNDAKLALNSTAAESTINWGINPNSSGFEVTGNSINETGGEWIFYAIA